MNVIARDPAGDTHKGAAAEEVGRILTLSQFGRKLYTSITTLRYTKKKTKTNTHM